MGAAENFQPGDRLLNDDGTWSEVTAVTLAAEPLRANNLTVNDFHSYFVAANTNAAPVWVHNNCADGPEPPNRTITQVGDGPLPTGRQTLDPTEISFSQAMVSGRTSDGMTHSELVASMRRDGWQGDPVDVVNMPDGAPTSMDNRRLSAARQAGISIEANVRNATDALTPVEISRFRVAGQPEPTTWGEAVQLRTRRQGRMQGVDPSWPERFPNGSIYDPDIVGGY